MFIFNFLKEDLSHLFLSVLFNRQWHVGGFQGEGNVS